MNRDAWIPHGLALRDFFAGDGAATIVVHSDLGEREEFPVSVWFREESQFWQLERTALDLCRGRVLDVGAGTGCHSLVLQARGLSVCAIDCVPEAVGIMRRRGVREVHLADVFDFEAEPFDTILMLTNGAGLVETLSGLDPFLLRADRLLAPAGQILLDSTDVRPEQSERAPVAGAPVDSPVLDPEQGRSARTVPEREDGRYVGKIQFQLEYRGIKGAPFAQLYVDPETLAERAAAAGWACRVIEEDTGGSYLAQLTRAASGG